MGELRREGEAQGKKKEKDWRIKCRRVETNKKKASLVFGNLLVSWVRQARRLINLGILYQQTWGSHLRREGITKKQVRHLVYI